MPEAKAMGARHYSLDKPLAICPVPSILMCGRQPLPKTQRKVGSLSRQNVQTDRAFGKSARGFCLGGKGENNSVCLVPTARRYFPGFGVQLVIRVIGGGLPAGGEFTTNHFPSGA